jgi:hypothetical protein
LKPECRYIKQLLSEYIDGVIDTPDRKAVSEHLMICPGCSSEYEALKSMIGRLRDIRIVKAPDEFLEKIHGRIGNVTLFERLREIFSFQNIRLPVELAAFTATAFLIVFIFNHIPSEEKNIVRNNADNNGKLTMSQGRLPAQAAEDKNPAIQSAEGTDSSTLIKELQIPVKLAMALTVRKDITLIPSQNVSFDDSGTGYQPNNMNNWQTENGSEERIMQPDEINAKIDGIIKSVEGKLLSRDYQTGTGYPARLELDIPAENYRLFLSKIETLGTFKTAMPDIGNKSEKTRVLIQLELASPGE